MKLWSIEDDGNGNFFWQLEDSFDTSSLKKITLFESCFGTNPKYTKLFIGIPDT